MADIEKVKLGCKCCSTDAYKCNDCPYWCFGVHNNVCTGYEEICADALSVIEEQQAEIDRMKDLLSDDQPCPPPPKGDKEQRWIPVSERLPEYTGTFLVWVGINQCGEGMHMECRTAMFYYPMQRFYVHYEVEAELVSYVEKWMPLPEPPQEG